MAAEWLSLLQGDWRVLLPVAWLGLFLRDLLGLLLVAWFALLLSVVDWDLFATAPVVARGVFA